jgi:hypothetical protein
MRRETGTDHEHGGGAIVSAIRLYHSNTPYRINAPVEARAIDWIAPEAETVYQVGNSWRTLLLVRHSGAADSIVAFGNETEVTIDAGSGLSIIGPFARVNDESPDHLLSFSVDAVDGLELAVVLAHVPIGPGNSWNV